MGGHKVDVLAIDRDGVGDVHAVLFVGSKGINQGNLDFGELESLVDQIIDQFMLIPANYKYIAVVAAENDSLSELSKIK